MAVFKLFFSSFEEVWRDDTTGKNCKKDKKIETTTYMSDKTRDQRYVLKKSAPFTNEKHDT